VQNNGFVSELAIPQPTISIELKGDSIFTLSQRHFRPYQRN